MDQEEGSGNHGKRPLEEAGEEFPVVVVPEAKILGEAYGVGSKPSTGLGYNYKQVKYWSGNRRYIDRHGPRRYNPRRKDDEISGGQSEPRSSQDMKHDLGCCSKCHATNDWLTFANVCCSKFAATGINP